MDYTQDSEIPSKLYYTIGEVAKYYDLKPYILHYWEKEFPQLSPAKRRGNRRHYQKKDLALIAKIRTLLYEQGYTLEGARRKLLEKKQPPQPTAKISAGEMTKAINQLECLLIDIDLVLAAIPAEV
jgi:DNA-binding transcriptional MerR regulator